MALAPPAAAPQVRGSARDVNGVLKYPVRFLQPEKSGGSSGDLKETDMLPYASRPDLADAEKVKSKSMRPKFEAALGMARELLEHPPQDDPDLIDDEIPTEEEAWSEEGHEWLQRRLARTFGTGAKTKTTIGRITK